MSGRLGAHWDAVFREPVDGDRLRTVVHLLGRDERPWSWTSPLALKSADVRQDPIGDAFEALGRDEPDQADGVCQARRINLVFNRSNIDQSVDGAAKVVVIELVELARQQDHERVLVGGQNAGDLGIGCHSCCTPPAIDGLVALAPATAHRNRSAIFRSTPRLTQAATSRTPFARAAAVVDFLYRALERLGDLVAGWGARITRGPA